MLDIKFIRENAEAINEAAKNKNIDLDIFELLAVDEKRVKLLQQIEDLSAEKNRLNDSMKSVKNDDERKALIEKGKAVKENIAEVEPEYAGVKKQYDELMVKVPIIPSADTPVARDDSGNKEVFRWGEVPSFDFAPKTHIELMEDLDLVDFEKGAKVSGYRGYYLKNEGTLMVMALMMYAIQ